MPTPGPVASSRSLLPGFTLALALLLPGQSPTPTWSAHFNGPGSPAYNWDEGLAITADGTGSVYVAGYVWDDVTGFDLQVLKYATAGAVQWARQWDGGLGYTDYGFSIAVDPAGDVVVAGLAMIGLGIDNEELFDYAIMKLDGIDGSTSWEARRAIGADQDGLGSLVERVAATPRIALNGAGDVFLAGGVAIYDPVQLVSTWDMLAVRYDGVTGSEVWAQTYNGPEGGAQRARAICVTGNGDVIVTGESVSIAGVEAVTIAYDGSSGASLWTQRQSNGAGMGLAIDNNGSAIVVGSTYSPSSPFGDGLVLKYSSTGLLLWAATLSGVQQRDVVVDASGGIHVGGAGVWPALTLNATKYDPLGNQLWSRSYAHGSQLGHWYIGGQRLAIDDAGNTYLAGFTDQPGGHSDGLLLKYATDGTLLWTAVTDGAGDEFDEDSVNAVAVDGVGNVYVTGGVFRDSTVWNDILTVKFSNTQPGSHVVVAPSPNTSLTFTAVATPGETTVTETTTAPPLPAGFTIGGTFFEIETTATFVGTVEVCFTYDESQFPDENLVRLLHYESSQWVDITSSLDTNANIVCGVTSSFSPFALAQQPVIVSIDVKPGDGTNIINLQAKGCVPVAILGTLSLPAQTIDPGSVAFAGAPVWRMPQGRPRAALEDVNHDGLQDLVVHIATSALQLTPVDTQAVLTAKTLDGRRGLRGDDVVQVLQ